MCPQNYAEYLLKKDVKTDKLPVVLIVVTLCLIVRFFVCIFVK